MLRRRTDPFALYGGVCTVVSRRPTSEESDRVLVRSDSGYSGGLLLASASVVCRCHCGSRVQIPVAPFSFANAHRSSSFAAWASYSASERSFCCPPALGKVEGRVRSRCGCSTDGCALASTTRSRYPLLCCLCLRAGQRTGGGASGMPGRSAPPSPARESRSVRVPLGPPSLLALPGTPFR